MHNYKKHFKEDGSFVLKEYRTNGKIRIVGEDNSSYIKFLKTNTPEEIAYVPPISPTLEEKRSQVINMIINNRDIAFNTDIEFNGNFYGSDHQNREMIIIGSKKAEKDKKNNKNDPAKAITVTGLVVELSTNDLIAFGEKFEDDKFALNNKYTEDYAFALTADEDAIDYYIENNEFK